MQKIKDYRALYGALALTIVGAFLSFHSLLHVNGAAFNASIISKRWYWELLLNAQILCFAFMWFSHHNRIAYSAGRWRVRAVTNFVISMAAVGMPIIMLILGAYYDWYRTPPSPETAKFTIRVAIYIWLVSNFAVPIAQAIIFRKARKKGRILSPIGVTRHLVAVLMVILLACNAYLPANLGYTAAAFLCCFHGALAYVDKALRAPPHDRPMQALA